MLKTSYERNNGEYMGRWFHDLLYFFLIIILMLEMIFGIIVETFRELRIHQQYFEYDKNEICFVCGVKRDQLEKDKKSYNDHITNQHNLWNYVNYMIRLKFSNLQDLNALNSYAYELLKNKNITWIPNWKIECERNSELDDHEVTNEHNQNNDNQVNDEMEGIPSNVYDKKSGGLMVKGN